MFFVFLLYFKTPLNQNILAIRLSLRVFSELNTESWIIDRLFQPAARNRLLEMLFIVYICLFLMVKILPMYPRASIEQVSLFFMSVNKFEKRGSVNV